MNSALADYLRASGARPFAWGVDDCCTFACDWAVIACGLDPAADWRGRCANARDAAGILRDGGGVLALARKGCSAAGLVQTTDALPGDVGVVLSPNGEAMAIRTRVGWAVKSERGVVVAPFPLLAAWRLPCHSH